MNEIVNLAKQFGISAVVGLVCVLFILRQNQSFQADNANARKEITNQMQSQIDELTKRVDMCQNRYNDLQVKYDSLLLHDYEKDENTAKILYKIYSKK